MSTVSDLGSESMSKGGMRIASHGLAVTPPAGWEAAIYWRPATAPAVTRPVLHAATVALAPTRGDYGSGVVELLGPHDAFVALLDFGPQASGAALFAATGLPVLTPAMYRPRALQRLLYGQAGVQRFFSYSGRGFCLYSVVGSYANRYELGNRVNQVVATLEIEPQS